MGISIVYRAKSEVVTEVVSVKCNPCGKGWAVKDRFGWPDDAHVIRLSGGYGNSFPGDMETFEIVVCEACLKKWVGTFVDPEVSQGATMWRQPYSVWDSETDTEMVVDNSWLLAKGETIPKGQPEPELPDQEYPVDGIWQHFKGGLYQFVDLVWTPAKTFYVVYRALYGDSKVWCRPLSMWFENVERDGYSGPRFKKV